MWSFVTGFTSVAGCFPGSSLWMSGRCQDPMPLSGWIIFYWLDTPRFIYPLIDIWVVSTLELLRIMLLSTFVYKFLCRFSWGRTARPYRKVLFNYLKNYWTVLQSACTILKILPAMCEVSGFSTSLPVLDIISLFYYGHPNGYEPVPPCGFTWISLMTNDVEHLFMCLLVIQVSSLGKES